MTPQGELSAPRGRPTGPAAGLLRAVLVTLGVIAGLTVAATASATWSTSGSGGGAAAVGSLTPPSAVSASSVGATVTVDWAAAVPPGGSLDGYTVTRWDGATPTDACGTDPAQPSTYLPDGTVTCTDPGVPDGTYAYTVRAVFRTWTAESGPSADVVVEAPTQTVTLAPGATNASLTGTSLYYRSTGSGSFVLTDVVTSVEAGPASATFPDIDAWGWTHAAETVTSGTGGPSTTSYDSSSYSWSPSPAQPPAHTVSGRDSRGAVATTTLLLTPDDLGPTGGALTVNGTAADGPGTTSHARTDFAIDLRRDYDADSGSGLATSTLTLETAPISGATCGTYSAPTTLTGSPDQTGLTTGCYRYTLRGADVLGNTASVTTVVLYDDAAPTQSVTMDPGASNAAQTGSTLYFRDATGSFTLTSSVTDADSGPASASFPAVGDAGWTHADETVTSGTGAPPTVDYTSSSYDFTPSAVSPGNHAVVGRDAAGNTVTTVVTVTQDSAAPTGGQLTVNGAVASGGAGSTSFDRTGAFPIDSRTEYSDAESGLASSVLTLASAPLTGGACGLFGAPSDVVGTPAQSGLATGCYRYVLTGTDRVGNTAAVTTTVMVDLDPPTDGAVTVNGTAADTVETTSWSKVNPVLINSRTDWTDAESGLATSTLVRTYATLSNGTCAAFGNATTVTGTANQTLTTTRCYRYVLTGTDNAGNTDSISTVVRYDTVAPVTGALTVNGTAASGGGTFSYSSTGAFPINSRTEYTDAGAGIDTSTLTYASATLSGNTCGTFGSSSVVSGTPAQSGLTTGCHRYTLTGTDLSGNTASTTHTVKVDLDDPTSGAVTVNGTPADTVETTSWSKASPVLINSRTNWVDGESGLLSSTLTSAFATLSNGTCATFGSTSTITGTTNQTLTTTRCYRYVLTGTDNAGNTDSISTVVRYDTVAPVTGALTVNGTAASGGGTFSYSSTGAFPINSRTEYTDAGAGIDTSTLTYASATLSGNTCGTFGSSSVVSGTPAQSGLTTGCHRYTLTGTDLSGNTASTTHTVKVDLDDPTSGAVAVNGTAASGAGTTSGPTNAASFPINSRTDWTDGESGIASSNLTRGVATYSAGACGVFTGATAITGTTTQSGLTTSCYRYTLTGTDNAGNTAAISTVVPVDTTAPTTGALTVNGAAASGAGTFSYNNTGAFAINSRTEYTDAASGIASSVLTYASATLSSNACGAFGTSSDVTGTPAQSGLTTGCHRYTLTGTDNAGNTTTTTHTVKVDLTTPTSGAVTVNGTAAATAATTSWSRSNPVLINSRTDWTDSASGLASSTLTSAWATLTNGTCGTFGTTTAITGTTSQTLTTTRCYRYVLTGTDNAGNTDSVTTVVRFDTVAPVTGALTVNSVGATGGGSTSFNKTGSFTISTRTDYTDAGSGISSSVLTLASATLSNNTCGTFGSSSVITGNPSQSGLSNGCYRYTLTGTDVATNTATVSTIVKVDLDFPTGGAVTVNGTAASAGGTTSGPTNATSFPIDSRTDYSDGTSGIATSNLVRASATLTNNVCGGFTGSTAITGTTTQSGLGTNCYRYTLTGTDNAGNASAISTIVKVDTTAPTTGALTVNGVAASGAGTSSTVNKSSYPVVRTDYTDPATGIASSVLTREFASLSGTTCGTFGSATTLAGSPTETGLAQGCYRYTLTGTDNAGNTASISTTVTRGSYASSFALVNGTGTAGRADQGDKIVATFSDDIEVSTLCSTWSGNGSDQSLTGNNDVYVVLTDGGGGNDSLSVSTSSCTLNFGSVALASTGYATSTIWFGGNGGNASSVTWTASTRTLTVTFGGVSGGGAQTVGGNVVATYTPSTTVTSTTAVPVGGTFATTAVKQF